MAIDAGIEAAVLFFMLLVVLQLLRRWTDLTFPEGPAYFRNVLVIAVAAAVLWMIPVVGWVFALATVAGLTMKFFDGDMLAGFYVAIALWGTHVFTNLILLANLRKR